MLSLSKGRYCARFAQTSADRRAAQALRGRVFGAGNAPDADAFDAICRHVLVEDVATGQLMCCFRLLTLESGAEIARSYSAQFYDLSALATFAGPMLEIGRFCLAPGVHDPDILRLAWGAVTQLVDAARVELLFGCSSFAGTDWARYADAFALLAARHLAPPRWLPGVKAPEVVRFAEALAGHAGNAKQGMLTLPPLLRSYLGMGGWVSDHAVIDARLGTLHVFTGLEIAAIAPARARALRMVAEPAPR